MFLDELEASLNFNSTSLQSLPTTLDINAVRSFDVDEPNSEYQDNLNISIESQ